MLKITKALPIALLTLVPNYNANETTVYIDTVTIGGNTSISQIRPLYTVTKSSSKGAKFNYYYVADGVTHEAGSCHVSSFSVGQKIQPPSYSNEIPVSSLGVDNTFIVEMVFDDTTLGKEVVSLRDNEVGNKCVYYKEVNNDIGLSSGYITQTYSVDPKINKTREDRIQFLNFEDNLILPSYNYFDISDFKFKYLNANYKAPRGSFYFDFVDTFALFDDLPIESETMYRRLPLECIYDDGICYFTLKNNLYYDPLTHKTSSTSKEGYYPTRRLYFPKENYDVLKKITCRIVMDIKGFTTFSMIGNFKITHEKKLFGDCEDSEYCIHSTEDTIENKREKEVEIIL